MHFAWMPQRIGLMVALPQFHLIGKWEEDNRIIKDSKRKFKISNSFELKCKWLELLGFNIIRMNYQEVTESNEPREVRDKKLLDLLKPLNILPTEQENNKD